MQFRMTWWNNFKWWVSDHLPERPEGWFAWRPVKLDTGNWAWLERVDRDVQTKWYTYENMFGGRSYDFYTTVTYRNLGESNE